MVQSQAEAWDEWYEAARELPDANVRLQAVEQWAQQPRGLMDLLANAMRDEDDAVRKLVEELYDQQLDWEDIELESRSIQIGSTDEE